MKNSSRPHGLGKEWWDQPVEGKTMSKLWYLPLAAVIGAASLSVWAQANAGPPPAVSPGVVVSNVDSGSRPASFEDSPKPDDSPKPSDPPSAFPSPTPPASIAAVPEHTPATQLIPAEPVTLPPVQVTHSPAPVDDKGGLRAPGVSDDGPTHDLNDDTGGLRAPGVSGDGPTHDLNDDKGGLSEKDASDDGAGHGGSGDDKGGLR